MNNSLSRSFLTFIALAVITITCSAQITTIKEALDVALKNETVATSGGKMKLYSANAYTNSNGKSWSFTFYDGGEHRHSVRVDEKGKKHYTTQPKGSLRVFKDIDFSKLPAPSSVLVEDAMKKSKTALEALGFKPTNSGKYQITYYVRSELRQKNKAFHNYKVSLPTGDGKQGKTVSFKNGKLDTISNSSIQD